MVNRTRSDVIRGLQCCHERNKCPVCPYFKAAHDPDICIRTFLLGDALALLTGRGLNMLTAEEFDEAFHPEQMI